MINWINSKKLFTTLFSAATIFSSTVGFSQNSNQTINDSQTNIEQTNYNLKTNLETKLLSENNQPNSNSTKAQKEKETIPSSPIKILKPMKMYSPVDSARISSFYGGRKDHFHRAIDIAAYFHKEVYASQDGKVEFAGWRNGYGYRVIINHGKDDYGREIKTTYSHLSPKYTNVKKGEWVQAGEKISRIGKTGNIRGIHLHYEVMIDGKKVNPLKYLKEEKTKVGRSTYVVRHKPEIKIKTIPTKEYICLNVKNYEPNLTLEERTISQNINVEKLSKKEKKEVFAELRNEIKKYKLIIPNNDDNLADNNINTNNANTDKINTNKNITKKYNLNIPKSNKELIAKNTEPKEYTIIVPKEQKENKTQIIQKKEKEKKYLAQNNEPKNIKPKTIKSEHIEPEKKLESFKDFKKQYAKNISLESKLGISVDEINKLNNLEKEELANFVDSIFDLENQNYKTTTPTKHKTTQQNNTSKQIAENKVKKQLEENKVKKQIEENIQLENIIKNTIDSNYTVAQNTMRLSKGYEKGTYQYNIRLPSLEAYIDTIKINDLTAEDKSSLSDTLNRIQNNKYLANKVKQEEFKYLSEVKDSIEEKLTAIVEPKKTYGIQIDVYNNKVNKTKIQATIKKEYGITVPLNEIKEDKVGSQYKYSFVNFSSKDETITFIKEKRGSGIYGLIAYEDGTRKDSWKKI